MEDSDNMSADDSKSVDSISTIKSKPKKRSLVERELETNLTARVTSPVAPADSTSLSRYGRARRLKTETDSKKLESPKRLVSEKSPIRVQSPVYKMHASNTPIKESPKKAELYLDNQIENIYQENISLSRFAAEEVVTSSPSKKMPKVYIQKDLIQRKDTDDPIMLIKNIFSPEKSPNKFNSHLNNILERSERFNVNMSKQNGYTLENSSVVKTLDFDSKKKKKENKDKMPSKNELFELEAKCMYQVGDLAWARMGTYPFWPCITTRDPDSGMFVKKKLFGRVEHDIVHVTFFGDNGRRSWIVDNMLRNYTGLAEFESTRDLFTVEDKKRDPRLYAAFFISEKKQALWKTSVDEAETLYREPKRLRIDMFNDMLERSRAIKTTPKLQKKVARTDSDVSLSESLYDSLFSEDDGKVEDTERSRNKCRNKSLDVSDVVTACLDNMAAKTGITKIQKQSHMDRWLQKAKSQTPEKVQVKTQVVKVIKINHNRKWKIIPKDIVKPYSLRRSGNESLTLLFNQNEHDYSKVLPNIIKIETKKDLNKVETVSNINTVAENMEKKSIGSSCDKSFENINYVENESNLESSVNDISEAAVNEQNVFVPADTNIQNNVHTEEKIDINMNSKENNSKLNNYVYIEPANSVPLNDIKTNIPTSTILNTVETQSSISVISDVEKGSEIDSNTVDIQKDEGNSPDIYMGLTEVQQKDVSTIETKNPNNDVKFTDMLVTEVSEENNVSAKIPLNTTTTRISANDINEDSLDSTKCKQTLKNFEHLEVKWKVEDANVNNKPTESYSHDDLEVGDDQKIVTKSDRDMDTNHQCVSMMAVEELATNDCVNDTSEMEVDINRLTDKQSCDALQVSGNEFNNAKSDFNMDTSDDNQSTMKTISKESSKIESATKIDVKYDDNADANIKNKATDAVHATNLIKDECETHSGLGTIAVSNTDCSNHCRSDYMKNNIENGSEGTEVLEEIKNTTLLTCREAINDCTVTTSQEEKKNDSVEMPSEENNEAKVGNCNTNMLNNCKITEDNLLNDKTKVDNFIFLDNSSDKCVNLSNNINGHSENVNIRRDRFIAFDSEDDDIYIPTNVLNGGLKIIKLNASVTVDNDIVVQKNSNTEKALTKEICNAIEAQQTDKIKLDKESIIIIEPSKESNSQNESVGQDSLVINNTEISSENIIGDNCLEQKENCDMYYSLNSPDSREKHAILQITPPLLDINITQSPRTRSFLDNLNSLELAICNDIAKLGTPEREPEKLSPTFTSLDINSKGPENKNVDHETELLNKNSIDTTESIAEESGTTLLRQSEDKPEIMLQNCSREDSASPIKDDEDNLTENQIDSAVSKVEETITIEPVNSNKLPVTDNISLENNVNENKTKDTIVQNELGDSKLKLDERITETSIKPENDAPVLADTVEFNKNISGLKIHNKLLETVKESHCIENGYHDSDSPDLKDSDDDFDIDAVSVNSEDSVVSLNKTDRHYKRKLRAKADRPLEDPDFLKYLEMRQDSLIDENPGLTDDEIIAYLYKTYLYEENKKSDLEKCDDIETSSMVKGLNERATRKNRLSRSVRDSLFQKKKNKINQTDYEEADTASVTSDSDVSWTDKRINKSQLVATMSGKVNCKGDRILKITKVNKEMSNTVPKTLVSETKQTLLTDYVFKTKKLNESPPKVAVSESRTDDKTKDVDLKSEKTSKDSVETDVPSIFKKAQPKVKENYCHYDESVDTLKQEVEKNSVESRKCEETTLAKRKKAKIEKKDSFMDNPEFVQYLELRQDALIDENPQLTRDEIVYYLYKTWMYEEEKKSEQKKADEIEQSGLVKGLNQVTDKKTKIKKKAIVDKEEDNEVPKEKPRRKASKPFYNEEYSDLEDELEVFEIFKQKLSKQSVDKSTVKTENEPLNAEGETDAQKEVEESADEVDQVEYYFEQLTKPKPNIFKGLNRERVCDICEVANNLIKCKSCHGMFHIDCVRKTAEHIKVNTPRSRKKKRPGRKPKSLEDSESQGDDKCLDVSEELNLSIEDNELELHAVDADLFEQQLSIKMKEVLDNLETVNYDSYSSDDGVDWVDTIPGKCEIVDVKLKKREKPIDYSDFKCNNCQKYDTPVCFVCKSATSKSGNEFRQKCNVAHCHKYYHLECLDHWPQSQFNSGEPSKNNKKISEHFEALTCPRHVCHTCVSDDPRGCKTRFSGDKLAKCVRCPATYHSFTKCVPAGTKILTGSHIICPRHYELRPGKVPCHVNTGWCFICALGGTLICCEYCPTSFHAECLNIDPPEGGYMCEDCETGRLPLYGEMVWVKLGNYRWWPGLILHPTEIPENLLLVRHSLGEFVVRFFGQYDHYWVNRGRVFPFQEGDSGRISSQKSKIDAAFTTAMEHAQRACEIMKLAEPNQEESLDIASSLLPPHYVKLKTNKPIGSVCLKKLDDPELSLTQCECDPNEEDPCGPYSQCLNRVLLTECGPTCRAGDRCNNRAFEKRLYPKLTPYRTHHRGWGLKTLDDIRAGQFVIEYVGELIDEEEFKRRMRRKHEIRDENYYFLTLDKERMIDAGPKGNLARFMNHCCEPNCETQKWTVLGDVRVGLFALHDIPANSEVTFNYNLECAGIEKKRCLCGAKRCSGYMGAKPKQDESQSKKNKLQPKRTYKKRKVELSPCTTKKQKRLGRPPKAKELTEIEKDLLIIKSATNLSSDDSDFVDKPKALKRKRVSFSSEEICGEGSSKRSKTDVGD